MLGLCLSKWSRNDENVTMKSGNLAIRWDWHGLRLPLIPGAINKQHPDIQYCRAVVRCILLLYHLVAMKQVMLRLRFRTANTVTCITLSAWHICIFGNSKALYVSSLSIHWSSLALSLMRVNRLWSVWIGSCSYSIMTTTVFQAHKVTD